MERFRGGRSSVIHGPPHGGRFQHAPSTSIVMNRLAVGLIGGSVQLSGGVSCAPRASSSGTSAGWIPRGTAMKTPLLALLILASAISPAQAQVTQEWVERYASPTPYSDVPYAMTVGADGHVYVTGTTATTGSNDWTTIKYNSAGGQEWLRTLDGGGSDAAFAITTDDAGNV